MRGDAGRAGPRLRLARVALPLLLAAVLADADPDDVGAESDDILGSSRIQGEDYPLLQPGLLQASVGDSAARLRGATDGPEGPPSPAPGALASAALRISAAGADAAPAPAQEYPKLEALARSLLAGLSTSLGAGVVLLMRGSPSPGQMAFALALAGGVMLTVSIVEMWLPQLARPERRLDCLASASLGGLSFLILKRLVPEPGHAKADEDSPEASLSPRERELRQHQGKQWRLSMLLMLALTAHNFPEGLAVAVSSLQSDRLGFVVMAAIAVHNIPEGIAIAMPVLDATGSRMKAMQMATLSGLAEPLGALVAVTLMPEGGAQGRSMDALLCVIGGIMTCVAFSELIPEAITQRRPTSALCGFATGVAIMMLTHELA